MTFNSPLFLFLFIPFFFIIYFAADKNIRHIVGLVGSLLFFSWGNAIHLPLMAGVILANFLIGRKLGEQEKGKRSKKLLWFGIAINLLVLSMFKIVTTYNATWLSQGLQEHFTEATFPLGLSYIIFQAISYLVDVFKGNLVAEPDILNFSLYIMLFPKIIVGPITRYKAVAASLSTPEPQQTDVADGIRRFIRGLAKKILIADILAPLVNAAFRLGPESIQTHIAWLAIIAYALQIYFDFAGYTDMALGLGRMMGFEFGENFNHPYISQSIGEFWRRWHISLSTWFRDYVFFPLERRRLKYFGQPINILIVFLLTGLWHGITPPFIVWGLLHGVFLVLENLFLGRWLRKTWQPLRHFYTLSAVLLTWVFFRAPSLHFAWNYLVRLTDTFQIYIQPSFAKSTPLPFIEPTTIIAFLAGLFLSTPAPFLIEKKLLESVPTIVLPLRIFKDAVLIFLLVASLALIASSGFAPGIYESF